MAKKDNVIGLAMDLDVSTLRDGLNEVKNRVQDAERDFRLITSSMDDWTKSTEGIQAKVNLLTTTLTEQKRALAGMEAELTRVNQAHEKASKEVDSLKSQIDSLNKEYKESVKSSGESSDASLELKKRLDSLNKEYKNAVQAQNNAAHAADKLKDDLVDQQTKINKTQKSLDNYEKTLNDAKAGNIDLENSIIRNGKALEKQSKSAEESSKSLDGLKSIGGGVVKAVAGIGAALVGAVGGFLALASSTRETRKQLGSLETAFTSAGHSAEEGRKTFESLYGVLGESDQALEASQHIAQLSQNEEEMMMMTDALTGVYAAFGKSLPIEGLAEAANESAKVGKVVGPLADAINWTTASSEDWAKALGGNEKALAAFEKGIASGMSAEDAYTEALAACNTEQERATLITESLNSLYGETAENYKEINKDIIESQEAQARLTNTIADFGKIAEPILTAVKNVANDLLESLLPIAQVFGEGLKGIMEGTDGAGEQLASSITSLIEMLITKVTETLPKVLDIVLGLIPQLATALLNAVPQILETLLSMATQIITALSEILPQILTKIMEILPLLIQKLIEALPQLIEAAIALIQGVVDALPTIIEGLIAALPMLIESIVNFLTESIPVLIEGAIKLFNAIIDALPVIITALVENLPRIINTIIDGLITSIPLLLEGAIQLFNAIIDAIPVIIQLLVKEIPNIITTIISTLTARIPDLVKASITMFESLITGLFEFLPELIASLPEIITSIVSGLLEGVGDIAEVGVELVKGLWEGIKSMGSWLWDMLSDWGGQIVDWFCDIFNINSPSKLMEDMIGKNIGLGVGEGILGSTKDVLKDIDKFNKAIIGGLELSKNIDVGTMSQLGSQVGNTINFVQNITSTKELTIKELSRYTNNLLDLDKVRGYL